MQCYFHRKTNSTRDWKWEEPVRAEGIPYAPYQCLWGCLLSLPLAKQAGCQQLIRQGCESNSECRQNSQSCPRGNLPHTDNAKEDIHQPRGLKTVSLRRSTREAWNFVIVGREKKATEKQSKSGLTLSEITPPTPQSVPRPYWASFRQMSWGGCLQLEEWQCGRIHTSGVRANSRWGFLMRMCFVGL